MPYITLAKLLLDHEKLVRNQMCKVINEIAGLKAELELKKSNLSDEMNWVCITVSIVE